MACRGAYVEQLPLTDALPDQSSLPRETISPFAGEKSLQVGTLLAFYSWTRPLHPGDTSPERHRAGERRWMSQVGCETWVWNATRRHSARMTSAAEVLCHLTADDLKELGITAVGHRRQLLVAIAKLNEQRTTDAAIPVVAPATAVRDRYGEDAVSHGGERRQLTVMFCDLVGSTALSEKLDPEELRSLLHAYRTLCGDVIARYDGFVARYVGDGILTYFGWPTAHEDDAERAVRAALEIVHTVKRASSTEDLSVRIGIATGPVVVGETAGAGDQSKLAVGSTPNLAARLQGLAAADQIVIAASTRRLVGNAFELTDLGEHDLKGIAEPVHAWRVERALVTESRFDASRGGSALTPLVAATRNWICCFAAGRRRGTAKARWCCCRVNPGSARAVS